MQFTVVKNDANLSQKWEVRFRGNFWARFADEDQADYTADALNEYYTDHPIG